MISFSPFFLSLLLSSRKCPYYYHLESVRESMTGQYKEMMQRKVTLEFAYHILEISHENYSTFFSLKVTPGVTPDPDYGLLVFRWI